MRDPYQVLGIQRGADDAEIKKAYRSQCKRWHPDLNPNDPTAEEHFKQVQEAYDAIMKGDTQSAANPYAQQQSAYRSAYGQSQNAYGWAGDENDPFGFGDLFGSAFGGSAYGRRTTYTTVDDSAEMQAARNFIVNSRFAEARRVLDSISVHNARWFYYSALASRGLGRSIDAMADAKRACEMEPDNYEYRSLYAQMQQPAGAYQTRSRSYGSTGGFGRWCVSMLVLNLLCQFFGGGCCRGAYFGPGYYM